MSANYTNFKAAFQAAFFVLRMTKIFPNFILTTLLLRYCLNA